MKAGRTNLEVGTLVKLKGLKGDDKVLNGLKGSITHPFAFGETKKDWLGFILIDYSEKSHYGDRFNIRVGECEII